MNRRSFITVIAAALVALFLPLIASAQGNYDPWSRNRDRDYRRDRRNDSYGQYGYDSRGLRDAARRIKDRSHDFQRHLDDALDRSRYDGTRREDDINQLANEFRNAADDFKDRVNDGRDINRSYSQAQRLLQIGSRIERFVSRRGFDSRTSSDWSQIRQDLNLVANVYGISYNNGGYNGRDDDYRNNRRRDNQRNNNDQWWRRLPF